MKIRLISIGILFLTGCLVVSCSAQQVFDIQPAGVAIEQLTDTQFQSRLNGLIRQLGDEDWSRREAATAEIHKIVDYYPASAFLFLPWS
jgi:hypothetical protein